MKKFVILVIMLLFSVQGIADEVASKRAATEKLLDLFDMDESYNQTIKKAMRMPIDFFESQNMPEEEKIQAKKSVEKSVKITRENFSWEKMKPMFVDIYVETLSLEDLEGLIKFYESPLGQRFVKKQPQIGEATMSKMQELMQKIVAELDQATQQALIKIKTTTAPDEKETVKQTPSLDIQKK
ncbi:MAG: DUF2059 domain-containing protein [Candidatus Aureabacteria bacterium]|nr:DUF2059 domain-containing protein [Candidatus Auribacterota bacterium]